MREKRNVIFEKLLYTAIIIFAYSIGKNIPLYMVDYAYYRQGAINAETLILQTINGDLYQCSLFALGISPYIMASMLVQVMSAFKSSKKRAKTSPKKTNHLTLAIALVVAIIQAFIKVVGMQFSVSGSALILAQVIAMLELIAGAMIIMWLCNRNKKYGIGGQSAVIYINVIDGIISILATHRLEQLLVPLLISLGVMMIVIIMENSEMRIPVQRISIHNIYADKNYLAIKLNPIGVMPAMFSSAFFMIPKLLLQLLAWIFPTNTIIAALYNQIALDKPLGIGLYIFILFTLTIGFSRVFLNPKELTEQYLKSGDSLLNIHAGNDTKRYISKVINCIGFLSATVMSICLGVPLLLQMTGDIESSLATLPSSVMMMTGIWCNLNREILAIKDLEAYEPFI